MTSCADVESGGHQLTSGEQRQSAWLQQVAGPRPEDAAIRVEHVDRVPSASLHHGGIAVRQTYGPMRIDQRLRHRPRHLASGIHFRHLGRIVLRHQQPVRSQHFDAARPMQRDRPHNSAIERHGGNPIALLFGDQDGAVVIHPDGGDPAEAGVAPQHRSAAIVALQVIRTVVVDPHVRPRLVVWLCVRERRTRSTRHSRPKQHREAQRRPGKSSSPAVHEVVGNCNWR